MYKLFTLSMLLSIWTISHVSAQQLAFRSADQGAIEMLQIPGGMMMVDGDSEPQISDIISPGQRQVDLQEGDKIIYINGAKISSLQDLASGYKAILVGEEVKLGIQRGDEKMIRSFIKPSEEDLEKQGIMFRRATSTGDPSVMEGLANPSPWPAGFLIGENGKGVVIGMILPLPDRSTELDAIQEGDVIKSLNNKQVETVADFLDAYDEIAVAEEVILVVSREGEQITVTFPRPEDMELQIRMN